VPGLAPVQTGIWYAPDLRYAVFDVLVASGEADEGEFLAHREVVALAREIGLDSPPVLHSGPRSACLMVPVRQPTRVPLGAACRSSPATSPRAWSSSPTRARGRRRASSTSRRSPSSTSDASARPRRGTPSNASTSPALLAHARRMVNPPRIASAASKWGTDDRGALLDEISLDVMIDLGAAFPAAVAALSPADEDSLRATILAAAAAALA
jgi:hypothetical protein